MTKTGWNWFALQLEDGRELIINEFLDIKTGTTFSPMANLIGVDGILKFTRNVILKPMKYWRSPLTNVLYPIEWFIKIPDFSMEMKVVPILKQQEMPVLGPLHTIWEGACFVSGNEIFQNKQIRQIHGKGFMELVGYANYISVKA
ncbi:lipocalin family protein [Clostridium sp. ZS2-4]|uniref:lipocalin family protein n=1 Tax=Clostridium sp. ZS2-4 TaxID=2987703 RepID=UPI00227AD6FD|nr:lipocalin family protein [Clostridium sp. ZS2-4]MCY6354810.1 lipocalin family protein [Clostridium sp. ZS2-4]